MRKRLLTYIFAAVSAWLSGAQADAAPANSFAIRNVRIFDGEETIPSANIVVQDGRISQVGRGVKIPAGLDTIDGTGKTLLPGLIDSHVHVFPSAQQDALRFGVTTELDMFDVGGDFAAWRRQRQSLARTDQADTWGAGLGATVAGGAPLQDLPAGMHLPTIDSIASAKPFVDARIAEGSDYIKVFLEDLSEYGGSKRMPTLSPAEACAVIAAAHEDGKIAIVHTQQERMAREAIGCGANALAHMIPDRVLEPDFLRLAKASGIFILTTDSVWAGAAGTGIAAHLAADPRVAPFLSSGQKQTLLAKNDKPVPAFFPTAIANTRALYLAGVPVLAGTDAPNPATAHGVSLHEELQLLVRAGLTPQQALHAATALPAEIFDLGDRGHVLAGYRADLVLVSGDPTRDISDTLSIVKIWKNGFPVDRRIH